MEYYATLKNIEYTIDESDVAKYEARGFTIKPKVSIANEYTEAETEVVPKKRGRKPKNLLVE